MIFGGNKEEAKPVFLEKEGRFVAQLNKESYNWLGSNFLHYNKIRTAQKGQFHLFEGPQLEEQMEATRSALTFSTRALNNGLILAYNSIIDSVKNAGQAPEEWPPRLNVEDRQNPPMLSNEQDALILGWMPIKFLNLCRTVRDKSKGVESYGEGMIKKLFFKVVGYYVDPSHWDPKRLCYFLEGIPEEATLADINAKLSTLKSELEQFSQVYTLFRFGKMPRTGADATAANALEDMFEISKEELAMDLYFQQFLMHGIDFFLFRYYLTLVTYTQNQRAMRAVSQIFEPALSKAINNRILFQSSMSMEREKIRVRAEYQAFFQKMAAMPLVEDIQVKGGVSRKINYSVKLIDANAYTRAPQFNERQAKPWAEFIRRNILSNAESPRAYSLLVEVMNTLVHTTQYEVEGKLAVVKQLRDFADMQEKSGLRMLAMKKQEFARDKIKKQKEVAKFRRLEQADMVETVQNEIELMEEDFVKEMEKLETQVGQRKVQQLQRATELEASAIKDGQEALGKNAASVYRLVSQLDVDNKLRIGYVGYLLRQIQTDNDLQFLSFYKHLFGMMHDLSPTEKVVLRKAVETRISLEPDEMPIAPEEMRAFQDQVTSQVTELQMEMPGIMEAKLLQGPVMTTLDKILRVGLTQTSMRLLLVLPYALPNRPAAKLPAPIAQKILRLNQLANPFPVEDIVLTNVDPSQPPLKRVNLNRLAKAVGAL